MSKSIFKHYKFQCPECKEYFEKGLWINSDGQQEPIECPTKDCNATMIYEDSTQDKREMPKHGAQSASINLRENWKKKIPTDYKQWMEESFTKRHGSEQTINMND